MADFHFARVEIYPCMGHLHARFALIENGPVGPESKWTATVDLDDVERAEQSMTAGEYLASLLAYAAASLDRELHLYE